MGSQYCRTPGARTVDELTLAGPAPSPSSIGVQTMNTSNSSLAGRMAALIASAPWTQALHVGDRIARKRRPVLAELKSAARREVPSARLTSPAASGSWAPAAVDRADLQQSR